VVAHRRPPDSITLSPTSSPDAAASEVDVGASRSGQPPEDEAPRPWTEQDAIDRQNQTSEPPPIIDEGDASLNPPPLDPIDSLFQWADIRNKAHLGISHPDAEPPEDEPLACDPPPPSWRTLADVPDDPPGPLLFGMLEPDGPNCFTAAPGVGKGMTGAYLIGQAQQAGMIPVIFDAERRPREWSRRVAGLGADRARVVYIEPSDLPTSHRGRPLWDIAAEIGKIANAAGGDLLMIDSIMPAAGVGEDRLRSDAQVPFLWVAALDALGIPSLSFGHPPKGQPEGEPFGSFAWVAAMRLTWIGTKAEGEGHRIRWRPRKRNERGHIPGVLLTVEYGEDGRPCAVNRDDDEETTRDWILAALVHGPRSVGDLTEEMLAEVDSPAAGEVDRIKERLSMSLNRMRRAGWVTRNGTSGRGVTWSLNATVVR